MSDSESSLLTERCSEERAGEHGLSVFFTVLCVVDLFGVFPVVALPYAIINCGVYGIPLVLLVFGLQLYTATMLGKCWVMAQRISPDIRARNRYPYAAIAELTFGPSIRKLVTAAVNATIFGAGVPNLLVAAQNLQLIGAKLSEGRVDISFCLWLLLIGVLLCPVMWLGSPKDMKCLAVSSVFIVGSVAIGTWFCIFNDSTSPYPPDSFLGYNPPLQNFLVAYGIIAFQFDIHPTLLTIQVDMKDSRKINAAVSSGFVVTGMLFTITSLLAARRYGLSVESNILQGLPPSYSLYAVALLVTVQLCLSSAVGNSALFQHVEDLFGISRSFGFKRCIIRSAIVALAVFLGETVPRFDIVMGLIGSSLTGPLMFVFPPIFYLRLSKMIRNSKTIFAKSDQIINTKTKYESISSYETINNLYYNEKVKFKETDQLSKNVMTAAVRWKYWYDTLIAILVMLIGLSATFIATYYSWAYAIVYAQFTLPCLLNATAASTFMI